MSKENTSTRRRSDAQHWLSVRRRELSLSQDELATRMQVAGLDLVRTTISNWERGRGYPPLTNPEFRRKFANVLELSPRQLLERAGFEMPENSNPDKFEWLIHMFNQLPPEDQDIVLNLTEQLLVRADVKEQRNKPNTPITPTD